MFQIFYKDDENLRQLRNIQPGAWVNITAPSGAEVEAISKLLNIPLSMLTDPLDEDERSRIEIEDDCVLIITNIPIMEDEGTYDTLPLGIMFTDRGFITVTSKKNKVIKLNGIGQSINTLLFDRNSPLNIAYNNIIEKYNFKVSDGLLCTLSIVQVLASKLTIEDINENETDNKDKKESVEEKSETEEENDSDEDEDEETEENNSDEEESNDD